MIRVRVYRHAESLSNAGGRTLEPAGIPLTGRGRDQAEGLAKRMTEPPELILASAFRRSLDTAAPILQRFPEAMHEVWPIQEFTYLSPASCINTSWVERKPRIDAYWAALDPTYVDGEGAENFSHLLVRARSFLEKLAGLANDLTVAVSHGQFMQAARLMAEAPDLDDKTAMTMFRDRDRIRPFANCELLEFVVEDGQVSSA
ncbi:MAG TPA: histidine phosphatase family protein [Hyphomonadaceae bacterium]|nr:histidine phosphatase family protein [Hyphomonadaceae bacterium]